MFAASKTASVSGGYQISRSLRFNSADTAYLARTPASASNRRTWTWSGWIKRSNLSASGYFFTGNSALSDAGFLGLNLGTADKLEITGWATTWRLTTQVFRDPSAWYHFVIALDTTQATANNRIRLYVNGSEVTVFDTTNNPTQNADLGVNTASPHYLSTYDGTNNKFNGYMTEVNFIDGQALTPSSFGETNAQTGVWQPKAYSGSYGTNGFYLNFSDNSNTTAATLGKDYSGNGNNWTPNNFSVTAGAGNDSLVDSPTSYGTDTGVGGTVRGNYCTLNPLDYANGTLSNGNLDWSATSGTGLGCFSTFAFDIADSTNQYYWEFTLNSGDAVFGIVPTTTLPSNTSRTGSYSYYTNGNKYSGTTATSYGASFTSGAVIGVAVGSGTITFYKNGVSQGAAFTGLTGIFKPAIWEVVCTATANFGQRPFAYTAPSGFKALCTQNLPTPTIGATSNTLATQFFNPILYTGDGTTPRSFTGVGFQPDFVWIKKRSAAEGHVLNNSVAGVGSGKTLYSNLTSAQGAFDQYGYLASLNSDGFTTQAGATDSLLVNASGATYVAWNWKANGAGSSNTSGSITSTASANTTSGFSVVTYTGSGGNATVGHGIGIAPSMVIVKQRNTTRDWIVYNSNIGATKFLVLDTTDPAQTAATFWNSTAATSTVFSLGTDGAINQSAGTYVAYCFAPIAGYSAFGSYTGNGSTDGPFVFTGFKPAYIIRKRTDTTSNWLLQDRLRIGYNATTPYTSVIYGNLSDAEITFNEVDILSNGFKIRASDAFGNASGGTYIYMALAQNPFKYSLAR